MSLPVFSVEYQKRVLALAVRSTSFFAGVKGLVDSTYFDSPLASLLYEALCSYYDRYESAPGFLLLKEYLSTWLKKRYPHMSNEESQLVLELVAELESLEVPAQEAVLDDIETFARAKALDGAIKAALPLVEEGRVEEAFELLDRARLVRAYRDLGVSLEEGNLAARVFARAKWRNEALSTFIPPLDYALRGGIFAKRLYIILAPSGKGKTTTLCYFGKAFALQGVPVVHITLEEELDDVREKYEVAMSGVAYKDLDSGETSLLEAHIQRVEGFLRQCEGKIWIKDYAQDSVSLSTIRHLLYRLQDARVLPPEDVILHNKKRPRFVLIIDYLDLLSPERRAKEEWQDIRNIYSAAKRIAQEFSCAVFSGSQVSGSGLSLPILDMSEFDGTKKKAHPADGIFALCQTPEEEKMVPERRRIFLVKVRDGVGRFEIGISSDLSRGLFVIPFSWSR